MGEARRLGLFLATTAALCAVVGCSRTPAPLAPVSGKVSYKGQPLHGGTIVFTPDAKRGGSGRLALSKINQDGTYHLATGDSLGASAGWYRVTVSSHASAGLTPVHQTFNSPTSLLPDKYRDPDLSLLACEIKPNRANAIDFNLE